MRERKRVSEKVKKCSEICECNRHKLEIRGTGERLSELQRQIDKKIE